MILDDSFVVSSLGAASKPLEWSARAGLAFLIVLIGIFVLRKSESAETS
jgi:hypothetical protein